MNYRPLLDLTVKGRTGCNDTTRLIYAIKESDSSSCYVLPTVLFAVCAMFCDGVLKIAARVAYTGLALRIQVWIGRTEKTLPPFAMPNAMLCRYYYVTQRFQASGDLRWDPQSDERDLGEERTGSHGRAEEGYKNASIIYPHTFVLLWKTAWASRFQQEQD